MKTYKIQRSGRIIAASILLAAVLIVGSLVQISSIENELVRVWVTTAVYMLGPLIASVILLPIVADRKWLYITASLMSLAIVFPWVLIDSATWAQTYMPKLGYYCNILFAVIIITNSVDKETSSKHLWMITGLFLAVLWVLPILL